MEKHYFVVEVIGKDRKKGQPFTLELNDLVKLIRSSTVGKVSFEVAKIHEENDLSKMKNEMMKTGVELITKEREEQLTKHGRTVEHDVIHNGSMQLSIAASAMVNPVFDENERYEMMPLYWNDTESRKMVGKPYKERLIIAGALIAAEIDRLIAKENFTLVTI